MPTRLSIHAFIAWPLFQIIRAALLVLWLFMEAVVPSCRCDYRGRLRNLWVSFSVEAWKAARQAQTGAVGLQVATAFATAVCGDWADSAAAFKRVHCSTQDPGGSNDGPSEG